MQERGCAARELLDRTVAPTPSLWGQGILHHAVHGGIGDHRPRALACLVGRCREPPSEPLP